MSEYKHGDWYCVPANEAEAREIMDRAVASGAKMRTRWNPDDHAFGVRDGVVSWDDEYCKRYTIAELRQKFPLPGERVEFAEWEGGIPPVGVECEIEYDKNRWRKIIILAEGNDKYFVRYTDLGEEDLLSKISKLVFRPIRTERENFVDAVYELMNRGEASASISAVHALYDAMQSGALKAPEVKK